ncbi:hypothetical protein BBP40_002758 [Aspergillus hancockii]|nr:hypothetical protein BBP40_002758 [Aspergillus hancockii]
MNLGGGISTALDAAVASTVRQGIVVCVAAGNSANVLAENQSPGREPLAITVGATSVDDRLAGFSSSGKG